MDPEEEPVAPDEAPPADDDAVEEPAAPTPEEAEQAPSVEAAQGAPDLSLITPHSYDHVALRVFDRPWALSGGPGGRNPELLFRMASIVRGRQAGQRESAEEIAAALEAARAQNGPRDGAVQAGAVAIIPMYGLISQRTGLLSSMSGGTSIDELRDALRTAMADPAIKAIVFDIDSPGGSVDGVPELAAELRQARSGSKPIVGQVNTLAASAAYWLLAQMSEIVVTPSGEVGSIGVFAVHEDYSKADEMAGVKTTLISAGKFKTEGNEFEPLGAEAKAAIAEQVDTFYQQFLSDVAKGRGISVQAVADGYGEGRTFLAKKALAAGMVDRIDPLEATVKRLQPSGSASRRAALDIASAMSAAGEPIDPAAIAVTHADPSWNARMQASAAARGPKRRFRQ